MRNYSAARGTLWQDVPTYYSVIGKLLPSSALANLIERNV